MFHKTILTLESNQCLGKVYNSNLQHNVHYMFRQLVIIMRWKLTYTVHYTVLQVAVHIVYIVTDVTNS
jgi:hypothetical protein